MTGCVTHGRRDCLGDPEGESADQGALLTISSRVTTKGPRSATILLERYLKNAKYVKDAASEQERKKFLDLVQYFKKYGDKYHVDWLLMAAQGYQESQLDQNVEARRGHRRDADHARHG